MSDIERRIRYLYMYYLKEQVMDKNHIMNYILEDIGNTVDNVKLIQYVFKEDKDELVNSIKESLLNDAKELEEAGYFDEDSFITILENYLENNQTFSVKQAYDYLSHLKYDPDSELYDELDDTEMLESYINGEV